MDGLHIFIFIAAIAFGAAVGSGVTGTEWRADCEQIGAHVSQGKVYECRVKP